MIVTKYRIEFHTQYEQCDLEFSEGLRRTFTSLVCSSRRPDTLKTLVPDFSSPPSSGRRRARIGAYRTATNAPKGWLAGWGLRCWPARADAASTPLQRRPDRSGHAPAGEQLKHPRKRCFPCETNQQTNGVADNHRASWTGLKVGY